MEKKNESFEHIDLNNIPLGLISKDRVSGFVGTVISRTEFFNGCVQYQLKPKLDKDNKSMAAELFDSQQLEVIGRGIAPKEEKKKKPTGGVMPDTPRLQ